MEKLPSVKALGGAIIVVCFLQFFVRTYQEVTKLEFHSDVNMLGSYNRTNINYEEETIQEEITQSEIDVPIANEVVRVEVFEGMTLEELGAKLDRSMKSNLMGKGMQFAELSIRYGVDPYLALAIVLHETGCYFGTCSTLMSQCNNIGGMKGSPGCGGGSFASFPTLDAGMEAFVSNLATNYYQVGLTSVEQIGKKYAEGNTWATKVHEYISRIKAN